VAESLGRGPSVAGPLGAGVRGSAAGGVAGAVVRGGAWDGRVGDGSGSDGSASVGAGSRSVRCRVSRAAERSEGEPSVRDGSTVSALDHGPALPFWLARTWITWTDMVSLNQRTEATTLPVSRTSNPFSRTS
jgi:hypothetical protein